MPQRLRVKAAVLATIIALGGCCTSEVMAEDQAASRVAFFGFQLINTSLESTTPKETMRIRSLNERTRDHAPLVPNAPPANPDKVAVDFKGLGVQARSGTPQTNDCQAAHFPPSADGQSGATSLKPTT
jgi:hypothetical protein